MASVLDSLLNDLVGRLHEMGIGKGTAAQQRVGPSFQDWSKDIYYLEPESTPSDYSYDPYSVQGVRLSSGMFGGKPIQAPQDIPPPPPPPVEYNPRTPERQVPDLPPRPEYRRLENPVMPEPPSMYQPASMDGLLTGDVLSMTQRNYAPERRPTTPPDMARPSPRYIQPSVEMPSIAELRPNMFSGRLGMPGPVTTQSPPSITSFGDEYENLRGKSVEDIQQELNNPNIDVNEQGDLVEILEYNEYGEPVKERVLVRGFSKDTPASDNIFNPAIK